jgi:hypothetical protein
MTVSGQRVVRLGVVFIWIVILVLYALPSNMASAATLTSRKITLQAGGTDGGSKPGGTVVHKFDFIVATTNNVGSIIFQYCTTASGSCSAPAGLDVDGVTLNNQTGATGFVVDATQTDTDTIVIDRAPASINSTQAVSYTFGTAINPSATNTSFYIRLTTTDAVDGGGATVDTGVVAASTATQIVLTGYMPESLIFCTGANISTTAGIPDCSTATAGTISFPDFSPSATSFITSKMAASTNGDFGYIITYNGATMTSGSNTVTAMTAGGASVIGTSQFGLNLVDNATPNIGTNVAPAANGTNYKGQPGTGYATADSFKFTVSGDTVASSDNGGAGPTDSQIFTISYIVNANGAQAVGTYTTTLTYICTPTF